MPKFIVTPGGAQIKIRWTFSGYPALNVFGGRASGSGTVNQATADGLRDIVVAAFSGSGLAGLMPLNTTLDGVGIRNVAVADQAEFPSAITGMGGTAPTSQPVPRSTACVVTFRTALAGPSFKGRAYMGGFDEDQNDGNANTAAAVKTAVESFWNTLRQNLTTIGYEQSILSPALPLRPSSVPGKPDLPAKSSTNERVTSCEVRNLLWGSQRRRTHRT